MRSEGISDHLLKTGIPVKEVESNGKKLMVLGQYEQMLQLIFEGLSTYTRSGADCAIETQRELNTRRANGYFETRYSPHFPSHWVPCIDTGKRVIAYDSLPGQSFNSIFFVGSREEVKKYLDAFFTTFYPYGGDFRFHTDDIFNYPV